MKAAIYTRLSIDREGELSTERQEADCRAYAQAKGWEVVAVYRDRLSGFKDVRRPDYDRFMEDLRTGRVDVGIIWKLDRLTRKGVRDIAPLLEALRSGRSSLASVNDSIDTTSAMGEGVLGLLASIAKQESENISLRTGRARRQEAERGQAHAGGRRPFGYRKGGMELDPEEAELIREAARRVLAGETCGGIARDWHERGILTPSGRPFRQNVLRDILLSERIRGVRVHHGATYPAAWPAVLDPETGSALTQVWGKMPARRPARRNLLTGLLVCGVCGARMLPHWKADARRGEKGKSRRYICRKEPGLACGSVAVQAGTVEGWVERAVVAGLRELEVLVGTSNPDLGPLLAEMEAEKARLSRAQDLYVAGDLPRGRYEDVKDACLARIGALQSKIEASGTLPVPLEGEEAWSDWDLDRRRQAVRAVFPRIVVEKGSPGPFRAARVRFLDRDGAAWRVEEDPDGYPELRPENPGDRRFLRL